MTAPATMAYSLSTAATATGLSTKTLQRAVKSGRLRAKRTSVTEDGLPAGNYVILADDLRAWLDALEDA